ncbi:MAG: serine/threonine protein kinase [Fibrella sp.]|nr:serine/threonine protein kinase [Armatimonadota bacterium]
MSTPRNENLSGKPTLGRYTILREVARSNDIVYEAVDPTINRRLAVKELNIAPTLTGQARRERIERFFREGRAAGAMNHPNIVTIFEIGEDNGRFFIAMEFLEGQSLRDRLQTVGPLPLAEAVATTAALCDALSYAHAGGVVHRDIKPDNVHILPGGTVKLTDFGIARILGEDSLTMAGQVFGTPSYMSPEQVTGNAIDGRTDQFSLAVLLYEMLTGRKPFTGDTVVTITYRIIHEPMPAPPGVPFEVAHVMENAMAKTPESRYGSVLEFKNALIAAAQYARTGIHTNGPAPLNAGMAQPTRSGMPYGLAADPLSPPLPPGASPGANEQTVMYGNSTQAHPMRRATDRPATNPPTYPPNQPYTTGGNDRTGSNPRSNYGAIAVASVILLAVVGGAGFALSNAFSKIQASQSQESLIKISNEGVELFKKNEFEKAAALFKKVRDAGDAADSATRISAASNETTCYRTLGQKAQDANDLASAEMWFTRALEVSPLDPNAKIELNGVQKRRGTVPTGNTPVAVAPNGDKIDSSNPLAGVLKPSPDAPGTGGGGGGSSLASPPPTSVLPGSQTSNDFAAANRKAEAEAQAFLDKGDGAFNAQQRSEAVSFWRQAVAAGPGSSAASKAQDRINRFGSEEPDSL